jgi:hypothetical protein
MTKGGWRSHGEWLLDRRRFSSPWVGPKAHDSSGRDDNFVAKWELVSDRSWGTLGALLARASRKTRNSSWLERAPPRLLETIASWRSRCTKHLQRNTARQCLCGKLSLHLRVEFNTNRHGNLAHTYYRMPASESRSQILFASGCAVAPVVIYYFDFPKAGSVTPRLFWVTAQSIHAYPWVYALSLPRSGRRNMGPYPTLWQSMARKSYW